MIMGLMMAAAMAISEAPADEPIFLQCNVHIATGTHGTDQGKMERDATLNYKISDGVIWYMRNTGGWDNSCTGAFTCNITENAFVMTSSDPRVAWTFTIRRDTGEFINLADGPSNYAHMTGTCVKISDPAKTPKKF
jgi:hypothetical protein